MSAAKCDPPREGAVVSGGTDGIGKAYAFELAKRGLRKFYLIGRNQSKLEQVMNELSESPLPFR